MPKQKNTFNSCCLIVTLVFVYIAFSIFQIKYPIAKNKASVLRNLKTHEGSIKSIEGFDVKSYIQGCDGAFGIVCFSTKEYSYTGYFKIKDSELLFPFSIFKDEINIYDWAYNPGNENAKTGNDIQTFFDTNVFKYTLQGERWKNFIEFANNEESLRGSKIKKISSFTSFSTSRYTDPDNIRELRIFQYKYDNIVIIENSDNKHYILGYNESLRRWEILQNSFEKLITYYNIQSGKNIDVKNIDFSKAK